MSACRELSQIATPGGEFLHLDGPLKKIR